MTRDRFARRARLWRVAAIAFAAAAMAGWAAAASARRGGAGGRASRLSTVAWGATSLEAPGRGRVALAGAPESRVVAAAPSGARLRLGRFEDPPSRGLAGFVAR